VGQGRAAAGAGPHARDPAAHHLPLPAGRCAAGDVDPKKVLGLLWAHVHGFTLLAANRVLTEHEVGPPEPFLEEGVRIILDGFRRPDCALTSPG